MPQTRPTALIVDFGGVLTTPPDASVDDWIAAENIDPDSHHEVMREWYGWQTPHGSPVHLLETGELPVEEFEEQFAARMRRRDGQPVSPAGLIQRMMGTMRPVPDMIELVRSARAAGVRTALLSNSWGPYYPMEVLTEICEVLVISGEVGLRKPDPAIYLHTLELLGLAAEECVYLDDVRVNVDAGLELGLIALRHVEVRETLDAVTRLIPELAR